MPDTREKNKVRVLISGFGGFPDHPDNPSADLVRALGESFKSHNNIALKAIVLKTEFTASYEALRQEIAPFRPALVIAFGVSARSGEFRLESTARNQVKPRPDATGFCPEKGKLDPHGPQTLRSTLPLPQMRKALKNANIPVRASKSAGDYVCNDLFYRLMQGSPCRSGFVHIPYSEELAASHTGKTRPPALPAATIERGATLLIEAAVRALKL